MKNGKLYELQSSGKFSIYEVEYDHDNDIKLNKWIDKQVPIKKTLV